MRFGAILPLLLLSAGLAAAACSGYMGMISSNQPVILPIIFPTDYSPITTTCTWVFVGNNSQNVNLNLVSAFWEPVMYDRVYIYPGINVTTGPPLQLYALFADAPTNISSYAKAVTIVLVAEGGRRTGASRNVTLNLRAPVAPPPCVNGSTTYLVGAAVVSNWQQTTTSMSPGISFPANWICRWVVNPVGRIGFTINNINIGPGDSLLVHDMNTTSNTSLFTYPYTNTRIGRMTATMGQMIIEFRSGPSNSANRPGFVGSIGATTGLAPLCRGLYPLYTALTARLSSHFNSSIVPSNAHYLPNTFCGYPIQVPADKRISFSGSIVSELFNDNVTIHDGENETAPVLTVQSGTVTNMEVVNTTTNVAYVVWRTNNDYFSDPTVAGVGFTITYKAVDLDTSNATLPRDGQEMCPNGDSHFIGSTSIPQLNVVMSPRYLPGTVCRWTYEVLANAQIQIGLGTPFRFAGTDRILIYQGMEKNRPTRCSTRCNPALRLSSCLTTASR